MIIYDPIATFLGVTPCYVDYDNLPITPSNHTHNPLWLRPGGWKHDDEAKKKMSKAKKGKPGPKKSKETKQKMGESHRGIPRPDVSLLHKGKILSDETKEKIRIARAKQISQPHNEETKLKISLAKTGKKRKPFTEEHKRKMSESARIRRLKSSNS